MSKHSLWAAIKDNWGQITVLATVLVSLHLFVMWVMVGAAVDQAFADNLSGNIKIVDMDKIAAANTRTGEENSEDIEQNRRANELAMRRIFGLPPPDPDPPPDP